MRRFALSLQCLLLVPLAACQGGAVAAVDAGTIITQDDAAIPTTAACSGDATHCLSGSVDAAAFQASYVAAKASLYRVFPYGTVQATASSPVASDGTFAFSNLDSYAHYFVQI